MNTTLNIDSVKAHRDYLIQMGKANLDRARNLLHDNCEHWTSDLEEEYASLLNTSENCLIRVRMLDDILKGVYS